MLLGVCSVSAAGADVPHAEHIVADARFIKVQAWHCHVLCFFAEDAADDPAAEVEADARLSCKAGAAAPQTWQRVVEV